MDKGTTGLMFSSKSDDWSTPQDIYNKLDNFFHFNLDPCASKENHKCQKYYTIDDDGLKQDWGGQVVFVNPPYSNMKGWAEKCYTESKKKDTKVVLCCPARVDTRYFNDYVYPGVKYIVFVKGRLKFGNQKNSAPFPSVFCVFSNEDISAKEMLIYRDIGNVLVVEQLYEKE